MIRARSAFLGSRSNLGPLISANEQQIANDAFRAFAKASSMRLALERSITSSLLSEHTCTRRGSPRRTMSNTAAWPVARDLSVPVWEQAFCATAAERRVQPKQAGAEAAACRAFSADQGEMLPRRTSNRRRAACRHALAACHGLLRLRAKSSRYPCRIEAASPAKCSAAIRRGNRSARQGAQQFHPLPDRRHLNGVALASVSELIFRAVWSAEQR